MIQFKIKTFEELTSNELYDLLQLRSEVFVVEQDCVYQDIDGNDQKAMHILGYDGDLLAAYTRVFKAGDYLDQSSIGRVVVSPKSRRLDYGKQIMKVSMKYAFDEQNDQKVITFKEQSDEEIHIERSRSAEAEPRIKISAQVYLRKFYNDLGFLESGDEYLEDGIPHMEMTATKMV
ncbi:GNAT family N-acetyltransferase [Nonlabens antarcticus]|uniref:GNAT family N-acetyltransferase n=1 Tax=Nonlabens antarcticus TaxID=392714 RepID=UPI001891DD69|nr:GNAT family N-acetyltransferase [Nonlabens antarcticus]